jgi:hypothetical protein
MSDDKLKRAQKVFGSLEAQMSEHPRLVSAVAKTDYVLFLGAGISKAVGYPLWEELIDHVRVKLERPLKLQKTSPLQQAQILWNYFTKSKFKLRPITDDARRAQAELEFNQIVLDALADLKKSVPAPEWFQLLKHVLPNDIVTTNWDDVPERLLLDGLANVFRFRGGKPSRYPEFKNIYKIHGSEDDPRHLVVTEDQYLRWETDDPYLVAKLSVLFSEKPTLCLGYSFRDPNVQLEHFRAFVRFADAVEPVYLLIDPTRHDEEEWGFLREQKEYFASRNVALLFGDVAGLLSLLIAQGNKYVESERFRVEQIEPVRKELATWVASATKPYPRPVVERLPYDPSDAKLKLLIKGLVEIGDSDYARKSVGLELQDENIPHGMGVCLLADLAHLLDTASKRNVDVNTDDLKAIAAVADRFTTKDAGAWIFAEHRERMRVFIGLASRLPAAVVVHLARPLAEHLMFAGEGLGQCWGGWNDLRNNIDAIPATLLRPLLQELVEDSDWKSARVKVAASLDKPETRVGRRVALLSKHSHFEEVMTG